MHWRSDLRFVVFILGIRNGCLLIVLDRLAYWYTQYFIHIHENLNHNRNGSSDNHASSLLIGTEYIKLGDL